MMSSRKGNSQASIASMVPDVMDPKMIHKTVRIFLSSTFTDTKLDRNMMMQRVFEPIRNMCREHGIAFEVVDLRWGIRQQATSDHRTLQISLEEVRRCQDASLGMAFIAILGDKYGWRPLPPVIPHQEFETLLSNLEDAESELVRNWYRRDDNALEPCYLLQPITQQFNVCATTKEERDDAWNKWSSVEQTISRGLKEAIEKVALSEKEKKKYITSITAQEVEVGILFDPFEADRALAIDRRINDIDTQSKLARRYINYKGQHIDEESMEMMKKLKEEELSKKLGSDRLFVFRDLKWQEEGITMKFHGDYIDEMCENVKSVLENNLKDIIKDLGTLDRVEEEVARHKLFCHERTIHFIGRANILSAIHKYIDGDDPMMPLVVYGESGVGKTSLVSKVVHDIQNNDVGSNLAIVYRFCGTSSHSSTGRGLLLSLCQQISRIYGIAEGTIPQTYSGLVEEFIKILNNACKKLQLVILIDALDQLSDENGARRFLEFIPRRIPRYVRFIVTTLPESGGCLERLKAFGLPTSHFIQIKRLDSSDGPAILDARLKSVGRTLTSEQRDMVLSAFNFCTLPLYLELAFQRCREWPSYKGLEKCKLEVDVPGMINAFYESLEHYHGKLLVQRVLGLLAVSSEGINPDEFLDILSCDDELLDDVLEWHKPPQRRLPPVLLVRLRHDLGNFLVQRGAQGAIVLSLYHRQFIEVAQNRYQDENSLKATFLTLGKFFAGDLLYTVRKRSHNLSTAFSI